MSAEAHHAREARGFPWLLTLATGVALAILLALGTWQVQRLAWKEGLIATIKSRIDAAPASLAEVEKAAASGGDIEYQPVTATGTFRHDLEQFFFATHDGQSGWFVYTPLDLGDDRAIFVNRGFIPYDRKNPASRVEGQTTGTVTVTGLARTTLTEKPSSLLPDNDPAANIFYWKDLAAMSAHAGLDRAKLVGFFIDQRHRDDIPGGYPIGGVTIVELPNNHLQYAVTWYGLALALAGVYVALLLRRRGGSTQRT
jgi:surfeit locus 1 family protein